LLYTDGVVEANDPAGRPYGMDRLVTTLTGVVNHPSKCVTRAIWEDLTDFQQGDLSADDVTLVCIKRRPQGLEPSQGPAQPGEANQSAHTSRPGKNLARNQLSRTSEWHKCCNLFSAVHELHWLIATMRPTNQHNTS
jgi:hypothetical protein